MTHLWINNFSMMVRDLMIKMMFTLSDESIIQKFSCLKNNGQFYYALAIYTKI